MAARDSMMEKVVRQFGRPTGVLGRLVGAVMALRPSNRERNRRTLELLGIQPDDRVLEIGFGPGLALGWASRMASNGKVVGIDHSEVMLRQARRRNAAAISAGRVELHLASADAMPRFDTGFDRAYAVNVHTFWREPVAVLRRVGSLLRPGGTIAITHMPRNRGARPEDTIRARDRIISDLQAAGFGSIRVEMLPLKPVPAVCVLAIRPEESS